MVWLTVDVDLEDIADVDIVREYERRGLGKEDNVQEQAKKFVQHIRCGDIRFGGNHSDDLIEFIHDLANKIVV